jgi:type III secretion protein V
MDFGAALRTYTLLTIGEGLVAQIPALVISTAAGILVTRVSSEEAGGHLGSDIGRQILAEPKALAVAAALLAGLAAVPGLPALPFLVLGSLLGLLAYHLLRTRTAGDHGRGDDAGAPLQVPIGIALCPTLGEQLLPARGASRLRSEWLPAVGARLFAETGISLPAVDLRIDATLPSPGGYALCLQEIPAASGTVPDLATAGETIAEHLHGVLRQHGHRLVGIQETQALLDSLARTQPVLVREVVPQQVSVVVLAEVLARLAREGISLRNLADILTAIARRGPHAGDAAALAESVRAALQRQITHKYAAADGSVGVYFLDSMIEETLREAVVKTEAGTHLALEPELARDIARAVERAVRSTRQPVILTSADLRRHLRALVEPEQPEVAVLAYQELLPEAKLNTLGQISIGA